MSANPARRKPFDIELENFFFKRNRSGMTIFQKHTYTRIIIFDKYITPHTIINVMNNERTDSFLDAGAFVSARASWDYTGYICSLS